MTSDLPPFTPEKSITVETELVSCLKLKREYLTSFQMSFFFNEQLK